MRLHTIARRLVHTPRRTSQPDRLGRRRNGYAGEASMIGCVPAEGAPSRCYSRAADSDTTNKKMRPEIVATIHCKRRVGGQSARGASGGRRRTAFAFSRLGGCPSPRPGPGADKIFATTSSSRVIAFACHRIETLAWRNCTQAATAFLFRAKRAFSLLPGRRI